MISTNRNTSNGEEGDEIELEHLNPQVPTETANRATGSDEDANGVVEDDIIGADIGRDGGSGQSGDVERGEAGTESVEKVHVRGDG